MSTKADKRWRTMTRTHTGKGDARRPYDRSKYENNWDRIFNNEKPTEENAKNVPPDLESFGQEKI
jgi:hypothetical protein